MTTDSLEMKNLLRIGLLAGLDLAVEDAVGERASEPKDPSRGRDRLDQFLVPTLFKLGDDEFLCLIRSHNLGFRRSERSSEALAIWAILFPEASASRPTRNGGEGSYFDTETASRQAVEWDVFYRMVSRGGLMETRGKASPTPQRSLARGQWGAHECLRSSCLTSDHETPNRLLGRIAVRGYETARD
jgi:hypothetical protein